MENSKEPVTFKRSASAHKLSLNDLLNSRIKTSSRLDKNKKSAEEIKNKKTA